MIIAATGHRPNKLGGYQYEAYEKLVRLARDYIQKVQQLDGVISGMALGWDQAWCDAALREGVPVHAAVPFEGQERQWPHASQVQYRQLLSECKSVTIVSPGGFSGKAMQVRNEWMVDRCHRVCALFDGTYGGTGNCVNYALSIGRPIDNLWELFK